ncbi:MAG: UDP-N-acetylmuramoyl-L-alanyl-D-glutamate--2,6-diaminopimelate ligase [Candidatus Omnitrophica bacterium CG11_big_fil_rev_8_21_14_0_20_41_12]|nr:MAG: UDP-N-acetylmuramoyl-L-alanyl-D-glutamate--2,6-diaminopimelate ligase [Candidatus Omnitrophica bacterium CG11_big_fil_rev_8_21_14_0_20_41_12]
MKIAGIEIKGITADSKKVRKGFVFVAIKGNRQDGSVFINEAIANGASAVVVEKKPVKIIIPQEIKLVLVNDCREFLAKEVSKFYGSASNKLKIAGITGTNGKTTIAYLIEALANESGASSGVIGTINYRFPGKTVVAKNTTPGSEELQKLLAQMLARRVKYCALEVSSHALDQDRVAGINFSRAIFTNLTQDHLDYHKNLENYFSAKAKLFGSLVPSSVAIINNDDKYACRIKRLTPAKIITYGIKNRSTVMASDIDFRMQATEFTLIAPKIKLRIKTNLTGRYNIYNILAAIAWGISERLKITDIKSAIEKFKNVPGRLERISSKQGYAVFVDYAHTPDALFNVISTLRSLVKGRIVVVFGCGGERDKLKRPEMGKIVTELADYAILTSDNPRSENPGQIIDDICAGIVKDNYCLIVERAQAIRKGLALIKKEDCLLIAGKGHENYQILKNKVLNFSDRKVAQECLKLMK